MSARRGIWTITRVGDRAHDGQTSVLLTAENSMDATKLWLQRAVLRIRT